MIDVEQDHAQTPLIAMYDINGNPLTPIPFSIEGAAIINVRGVARSAKGDTAICGSYEDRNRQRSQFVSWIPAGGTVAQTVRVHPYLPHHIVIADDGTLWTQGI